ncbi:MAG: response regulator transcription factor [Gemmatimonadota bacterium]
MSDRPTLLIADDHPVVAEALSSSLERWFEILGSVVTLDAVDGALRLRTPDVVVLDLSFGEESSLRLLPTLVQDHPGTRFVILTAHIEPVLVDAALRAGASAYVVKQSAPSELRVAIEEALAGRQYVTPLIRHHAPEPGADPALPGADAIQVSERQQQILRLLRAGNTYRQIADELGIATKTVEYHINALRIRLGVQRTSQLLRWAETALTD